jgi:hypothetical protein
MANNDLNLVNDNDDEKKQTKKTYFIAKFCCSLFLIFIFTLCINILRPLTSIVNVIFSLVKFDSPQNQDQNQVLDQNQQSQILFRNIRLIGLFIVFGLRLIPLFIRFNIIRVLILPNTFFQKFLYFFYVIIECIFELPLSFLYESPGHSLFLLHEKGIGEILNPSIIFFPTEHILSWYSILINFVSSIYFMISPIIYIVLQTPESDESFDNFQNSIGFQNAFYVLAIVLNLFCLIFLVILLLNKCFVYNRIDKKSENKEQLQIKNSMEKIRHKKSNSSGINEIEKEKDEKRD